MARNGWGPTAHVFPLKLPGQPRPCTRVQLLAEVTVHLEGPTTVDLADPTVRRRVLPVWMESGPARWLPPLPPHLPDARPLTGTVPLDRIAADLFGADRVDFDDPRRPTCLQTSRPPPDTCTS